MSGSDTMNEENKHTTGNKPMTTKHTHGPWYRSIDDSSFDEPRIIDDQNRFIMRLSGMDMNRDQDQANVRLVAAAPDLLNACKQLIEHLDSLPDDTEKCRHLKLALNNRAGDLMLAAIAKAEGN